VLALLLGFGTPETASAHELLLSAGVIARDEVLLLANEARPDGAFTLWPRVGIETAIGDRWRAGVHGLWTGSSFRVDPAGTGNELPADSWRIQLTAARVILLACSIDAFVGPVLEYGESDSVIDAG